MDALLSLARLPAGINSYTDRGHRAKLVLHSAGRAFLQRLAADLDLRADVRSNVGGMGVSGEVILDADGLYAWLQEPACGLRGSVVLTYRYQPERGSRAAWHGRNRTRDVGEVLRTYPQLVAELRSMLQREVTA
jgi:hypothetical protein